MSERIPVKTVNPNDFLPKSNKIYTKLISGYFQNIRTVTLYSVFALFLLLPWLKWHGQQAILLDIPNRHFYVFGANFMPQDFFLLAVLFMIAAFTLFAVTVFGGRVFCGYTCPQTVWVNLFMRVEKLFEGERNKRIKLDKEPWTFNKIARRAGKHTVWMLIALITALSFVSYFSSVKDLYESWRWVTVAGLPMPYLAMNGWQWFFVGFFTLATYMNAGFMREQFCFHVCPYGRFQSVMFDRDTLIVSYDYHRGEPRGARKRSKTGEKPAELGDCIDCDLCVQVCPTGIDIRNGLQMECIQCAACLDACNSVMDRMQYPRGLVRYTTERELVEHEKTHWLRPRLLGYIGVLAVVFVTFGYSLFSRVPVQMEALRDRNQLYSMDAKGLDENSFLLKITNKTQQEQTFKLSLEAPAGISLERPDMTILLDAGEVSTQPVTVLGDLTKITAGDTPIKFKIVNVNNPSMQASAPNEFLAPTASDRARKARLAQHEQEN